MARHLFAAAIVCSKRPHVASSAPPQVRTGAHKQTEWPLWSLSGMITVIIRLSESAPKWRLSPSVDMHTLTFGDRMEIKARHQLPHYRTAHSHRFGGKLANIHGQVDNEMNGSTCTERCTTHRQWPIGAKPLANDTSPLHFIELTSLLVD